jgi:hypothetical protein
MRTNSTHDFPPQGYPIRSFSFVYSLAVHGAVIGLLLLAARFPSAPARPVYNELVQAQPRKLVFYDLRKALPEVSPVDNIGQSTVPRGLVVSKQAIIATAPKPISKTQSVFVLAPKIQLPQDVPVPDLVARTATSLPSLPAPPKPAPPPPKAFVPPPINRQPKLPVPLPAVDGAAPLINPQTAPAPAVLVNGMSALSRIAAPRPEAPPVATVSNGNANVDVAVANLEASKNSIRALPEGERPGQFSKAPTQGAPASGATTPSALTVPNLSVRESLVKSPKSPEEKPPAKTVLYAERVRNVPHSTLSVALRSATRTIPAAVDARFRGRNVYAIVIPIENMPVYAGDWIVWFAEREPKPGETPLIYAPMPFRKLEAADEGSAGERLKQRIQVAATIGADGKLTNIALVTNATPAAEKAVSEDVASWEFKAATRNGIPVDVEVVIEIPFNLPIRPPLNIAP